MSLIRYFDNKTAWSTRQLKALCLAVIKHEGSRNHWIRIQYKTRRFCNYHGRAVVSGTSIEMFVPRTTEKKFIRFERVEGKPRPKKVYETVPMKFNTLDFAQVLTHEIHHNLGIKHEVMNGVSRLNCEYVKDFIVEPHKSPPKPQVNRVEVNRLRAEANLKRARTRFKRAQSLLKRCERKVRYYQKRGGVISRQ